MQPIRMNATKEEDNTTNKRNELTLQKRKLPKLMACMTKSSVENMRNKLLFSLDVLDSKGIRRMKMPLQECLILELKESGFTESSSYLADILYDNSLLVNEDEIGIVVDLRKREDYLEHICVGLQAAERERDRGNPKKESLAFLKLAVHYSELGKGILWLAEKFFLAAIAVASRHQIDGGRFKSCCKFFYASFLLDKFPGAEMDEPHAILTEVRDTSIGKPWLLYEPDEIEGEPPKDTLFARSALRLFDVLLAKARAIHKTDVTKAERLSRLAERRARDAQHPSKAAEAIIEVGICQLAMNNLNNAQKSLEKAHKIYTQVKDVVGMCEALMHLAAVRQKLGEYDAAARILTDMGALAMEHNKRRQLGRALHLLGELHLRRERPELGTQHLAEAFSCFMGFHITSNKESQQLERGPSNYIISLGFDTEDSLGTIYECEKPEEIYEEEAEQSRFMTAISAGQELMSKYFDLLKEAGSCSVAKVKIIEWKLENRGWWVERPSHNLVPCMCPKHNRTPLDVLWYSLEQQKIQESLSPDATQPNLERVESNHDIKQSTQEVVNKHTVHISQKVSSNEVEIKSTFTK